MQQMNNGDGQCSVSDLLHTEEDEKRSVFKRDFNQNFPIPEQHSNQRRSACWWWLVGAWAVMITLRLRSGGGSQAFLHRGQNCNARLRRRRRLRSRCWEFSLGKNKLPLSDSLFDITRNYAAAAAVTARCNAVAADAVAG